jgi:N-acetylneuraminic acid mutarotase
MSNFRIAFCAATFFALTATFGVDAQDTACHENHYILPYAGRVWLPTGDLNVPRSSHTATLLPDGRVLVAGGRNANAILGSAELYDPATGTWSITGGLNIARVDFTATLLPSGKVLVAGGISSTAPPDSAPTSTAELYDPATGLWSPTGSMTAIRSGHSATLLENGNVLIAGGTTAELYDPTTGTWSATGSFDVLRYWHTATLLQDGGVLIAGGNGGNSGTTLVNAEVYDPVSETWSTAADLEAASLHTATLLADGKVLIAGGFQDETIESSISLNSALTLDPATGQLSDTGNLSAARAGHTATLLPDGEVLVAGGYDWNSHLTVEGTELYDATSATWTATGNLSSARISHTATLLLNGTVLVAGGYFITPITPTYPRLSTSITLGSAELYGPGISGCQ